jgi:ubiquitin carboxyl-terminal hydrolase 10
MVTAALAHRAHRKLQGDATIVPPSAVAPTLGDWVLQYWSSASVAALPVPRCFSATRPAAGDGPTSTVVMGNRGELSATGLRQEDASEFFQALVRRVDADLSELGVAAPLAGRSAASERQEGGAGATLNAVDDGKNGGRGWLTVGKGKERLTVRSEDAAAAGRGGQGSWGVLEGGVFNGTLRVNVKNAKGTARGVTSVVVEPFLTLNVPVSAMNRVNPAAPPTVLDCIVSSMAKEAVDAEERVIRREMLFGQIPLVLVVQLSRWAITREGEVVKLDNVVSLASKLIIPREMIFGATSGAEYQLQSIICHRGNTPNSGHYVTYVLGGTSVAAPAVGENESATAAVANDSRVTRTTLQQALKDAEKDAPYLLFYAMVRSGGIR